MKKPDEAFSFPPETSTSSITRSRRRRLKLGEILLESPPPTVPSPEHEDHHHHRSSSSTTTSTTSSSSRRPSSSDFPITDLDTIAATTPNSPYITNTPSPSSSPWTQTPSVTYSPYTKSPWTLLSPPITNPTNDCCSELIGSLVREEGHVYSLATSSQFLYTGSDSKNIRVWSKSRLLRDSGGFKSGSGLVKSIIVDAKNRKLFTGHQDGKIRVWRSPPPLPNHHHTDVSTSSSHRRVGSLPTWSDTMWGRVNPAISYIQTRRHGRRVPRFKHYDAVSCLSINEEAGLLYSSSWDKTIKVWRIKDSKCVESIDDAHHDAVNAVVVGFDGLVFSGSADGTIKVWRRELHGTKTRHFYLQTLLDQQNAVTSLAVSSSSTTTLTDTTTTDLRPSTTTTNIVYGGTSDGLVSYWEWEERLTYGGVLRGHKQAVLCVSTAGCLVLTGSADNTICVWRREGGGDGVGCVHTFMSVLSGHGGPVKCLAVEEEEEQVVVVDDNEEGNGGGGRCWRVYSGSLDKSVKVWRVREDGNKLVGV